MSQAADEALLARLLALYPRDAVRALIVAAEESQRRGSTGDARPWTARVEVEFDSRGRVEVVRVPRIVSACAATG